MYKNVNLRYCEKMMLNSISPPKSNLLPSDLEYMSNSHLLIATGKSLSQFIVPLSLLNTREIDEVRLQILHTIEEINNFIKTDDILYLKEALKRKSLSSFLIDEIDNIYGNLDLLKVRLEENKKDKVKIIQYITMTRLLFEGLECMKLLPISEDNCKKLFKIKEEVIILHEDLLKLGILDDNMLCPIEDFSRLSINGIKGQLLLIKDMDFLDIAVREDLIKLSGEKEVLWKYVQSDEKERLLYIKNGKYNRLNDSDASLLQKGIINIINGFEAYNKLGFVTNLKRVSIIIDTMLFEINNDNNLKELKDEILSFLDILSFKYNNIDNNKFTLT